MNRKQVRIVALGIVIATTEATQAIEVLGEEFALEDIAKIQREMNEIIKLLERKRDRLTRRRAGG